MQIKLLTDLAYDLENNYKSGTVLKLDEKQAKHLVNIGSAVEVDGNGEQTETKPSDGPTDEELANLA